MWILVHIDKFIRAIVTAVAENMLTEFINNERTFWDTYIEIVVEHHNIIESLKFNDFVCIHNETKKWVKQSCISSCIEIAKSIKIK